MAKRGRSISLDGLVRQLSALDKQRQAIVAKLKSAFGSVLREGDAPFPLAKRGTGRPNPSAAPKKRRKMSAKARKAISDAQKARWAKQKAGKK